MTYVGRLFAWLRASMAIRTQSKMPVDLTWAKKPTDCAGLTP